MGHNVKDIDLIVIHCSASKETVDYTFDQLKKDHLARGFRTCGYHLFIAKDGTKYQGRPFSVMGAHVKGHNTNSIGICYEGGLDKKGKAKDTRTEEQKAELLSSILDVLTSIEMAGGDPKKVRITGHRDLSPDLDGNGIVEPDEWVKQCPCFYAEEEYDGIVGTF